MEKENKKINYLFMILVALTCFCCVRVAFQNDTFFSIAVGRQIEQTGVDMIEHLTWHDNLSYTYSHWLYDILNYTLYTYFGFKGIYFFTVLMTIFIGQIIYYILKKVCNRTILIPFAMTEFALVLSIAFFTSRAQIISYPLFILEVYFIEQLLKTNKKRYKVVLIIIPLIIANFHAALWPLYFVLYLPYVAENIFNKFQLKNWNRKRIQDYEELIEKETDEEQKEKYKKEIEVLEEEIKAVENNYRKVYCNGYENIKSLLVVGAIAFLTGFCTPIGSTPFTYMFKTMNDGVSSKYISELQIASIPTDITFFAFVAVLIFLLLLPKKKIRLSDLFFIVGFVALAFCGKRNLGFLYLIGIIPLTRVLISSSKKEEMEEKSNKILEYFANPKVRIISTIYVVFILFTIFMENNTNINFVDEEEYPVGACEYILENIDLSTARIYNGFNYGSYMEYVGIPVYMDSRSEMYTKAYNDTTVFQDYVDFRNGKITYDELVSKYDMTHLLLEKDIWINNYMRDDDGYNIIYEDDYFVLYEVVKASAE